MFFKNVIYNIKLLYRWKSLTWKFIASVSGICWILRIRAIYESESILCWVLTLRTCRNWQSLITRTYTISLMRETRRGRCHFYCTFLVYFNILSFQNCGRYEHEWNQLPLPCGLYHLFHPASSWCDDRSDNRKGIQDQLGGSCWLGASWFHRRQGHPLEGGSQHQQVPDHLGQSNLSSGGSCKFW